MDIENIKKVARSTASQMPDEVKANIVVLSCMLEISQTLHDHAPSTEDIRLIQSEFNRMVEGWYRLAEEIE
jgi:hypothetical protein